MTNSKKSISYTSTVVKRDGSIVEIDFNKITNRIKNLCNEEELSHINVIHIVKKTIEEIYPNIPTQELDIRSANVCAEFVSDNPWYGILGGRILASNLQKNLKIVHGLTTYSDRVINLSKLLPDYYNSDYVQFVIDNKDDLDKMVDINRDYDIDYFGFRTLEKSYLQKVNGQIMETPQDMWMRVAVNIHFRVNMPNRMNKIKETYDLLSNRYFIHATPTLFNAGSKYEQMSSCFLLGTHDSLDGIFKTIRDCGLISKWAGGIGVHVSNIRATGAKIKSTNGESSGIIPMLKVYNDVGRYCNQCFTPETIIYTKNGCKMISNIQKGDEVITIDGTYNAVNEVFSRNTSESIYQINTEYSVSPLECTGVHNIYVLKNNGMTVDKVTNALETNTIKPSFVEAKTINVGDYMAYPIPEPITNDPSTLTEDDCKFYGIMVTNESYRSYGHFGYVINPGEWLINYLTNKGVIVEPVTNMSMSKFEWNDNLPFTYEDFYNTSNKKAISEKIFNLSNDKIKKVIEGLFEPKDVSELGVKGVVESNGYDTEKYYLATNKKLMDDICYLLLKVGIPSYCYEKLNNINQKYYKICIVESNNIVKWNNMLFSKVKSITTKDYEGKVYDLNIADNHNYTTNCGLVHNSGRRNGSIAVYLEPWHADVFEFLELKLNTGADELRARDLFLALWVPDLFMKQVKSKGDWYLMSPDVCPNLTDTCGKEFEKLYWSYVEQGKYVKKVEAAKLWEKILVSQIETGVPYIAYKDHVNRKTNQSNIGVIKSSNLCIEIMEVSDHQNYAVCNLASIAVNKFLNKDSTNLDMFHYDWEKLHHVAKVATYNLNNVIDYNFYPTPETSKTNNENRPIGIGIQGLADLFYKLKIPFESDQAIELDRSIMETIYHGALEMSIELAEKYGAYKNFEGSPFSKGILQFDMWNVTPSSRYDWNALKEKMMKVGTRNSLLTALMPTATTSQILGNCECMEVPTSNLYSRKTLAGTFMIINKYLIDDLKQLGLWDLQMKDDLISARGSIQNIYRIPSNIKELYKTVWEVKQKRVIDHAIARGPYVDQSQSMNIFLANPTYDKITSALFYGWENGLKTGCYYLRSMPAIAPQQFSQEVKKKETSREALFCSLANPEACLMCSS